MFPITKLEFKTPDFKVDLILRDNRVVVAGNSSTGKSLITNAISELSATARIDKREDLVWFNVFVFNYRTTDLLQQLSVLKGKLIIIDNGDLLLSKEIIKYINDDVYNTYLIFGRALYGLEVLPQCTGTLKTTVIENTPSISIEYTDLKSLLEG